MRIRGMTKEEEKEPNSGEERRGEERRGRRSPSI